MAFQARKIEMSYQYAPLLPVTDTTFLEQEYFLKTFGNEGNLIILGVEDKDFFKLNEFNAWLELSDSIACIEGVTNVFSIGQAYNLEKDTQEKVFRITPIFPKRVAYQTELDSLSKTFKSLPFYKDLLYNESTDAYLMAITVDDDIFHSNARVKLVEDIREQGERFAASTKKDIKYSGLPYIRVVTA